MISLLEVAERSQRGPKMDEKEWDMNLFRKISALLKKYEIKQPTDGTWFNMDDGLVDRAFEAAIEFLSENGVYCITTNRVVQFSREEILTAVKEAPNYVLMGEGRDQRVWKQRKIEGKELLNLCPGHHSPFTEDLAHLVVKNFAQIPRTDFLEGFNFTSVDGYEIFGQPIEVFAVKRQMAWLREGIRNAGRPGLSIVLYPITTRASVLIAAMDPDRGLRRTDGILLSLLPDLKCEHDLLATAIACQDYGCYSLSGSFSMAGGFCGGVEGAIIEGICKPIAAMLCYRDYINYTGVEYTSSVSVMKITLQPYNWARSVVNQALNTKTNTCCMAWVIPTSGPGTELALWESAIRCIEAPINGCNLYAPRRSRAEMNKGQTPLDAEWMVEVSDATIKAGLDRLQAGEVLRKVAEHVVGKAPQTGMDIRDCYDLVRHAPRPAYKEIYLRVKNELAEMGLDFG